MVAPSRILPAAAAVILLASASACGERSEPTGPAASLFPITVTGGDDRPVTLPAPARRIALLDPAFESTLEALGAGDRVVGTPLAANGELRAGELRRLEPDLVLTSQATDPRTLSRASAATAAPVYVAQGASVREVQRTITQLGMITATPAAARALVRDIERRRRAVIARVRGRPLVDVFVDLGFFAAASNQTLAGDLVRLAGGRNVAGATGGPIDLADLRRLDPDVYVVVDGARATLRDLRAYPLTRRLRAVREGRVVFLHPSDLDPGPQVGRTLEELAFAFHPDASR